MFIVEVVLFSVLLILGVVWAAIEWYGWGMVCTAATIGLAWYLFSTHIAWQAVLFKWLPLYLGAGVIVGFLKWFMHVAKAATRIRDAREEFKNHSEGANPDPAKRRYAFAKFYMDRLRYSRTDDYQSVDDIPAARWNEENILAEFLTPRAKDHIERITYWILEWPFVVVATIFDDILVKFARNVARFFDWMFTTVSQLWISKVLKDL